MDRDLSGLAMSVHDLKREVRKVAGMLVALSLEMNRHDEAAQVAGHIASMQSAAGELLSSLEDTLSWLDRETRLAMQFRVIVRCLEDVAVFTGCGTYGIRRGKWLSDRSALPPHVWNI